MVNRPELPFIIRKLCWQLDNLLMLFYVVLVSASIHEIIPNVILVHLN